MRLPMLVIAALIAFAANSLLNRWALLGGDTGPAAFALLRLCSGAVVLAVLVMLQSGQLRLQFRAVPVVALAAYAIGFSFAYITLETGIGALILFGVVQLTLFAIALGQGDQIGRWRWVGTALAFAGLVILLRPGSDAQIDPIGVGLMIIAAVGWGVYTFMGRGTENPLAETAQNFIFAAPLALGIFLIFPDQMSPVGAGLAILSGAITSGVGYAIWYAVLPKLETSTAAILQLSVPVIAALMGIAVLGEAFTWVFLGATSLVILGTVLALRQAT